MQGLIDSSTLDAGYAVLAVTIAVLTLVSFAFALLALLLRFLNDRATVREAQLTAAWEPAMLEVLAGTAPPSAVAERVEARDTDQFLTFLMGYARRLRGEERDMVRELAGPHLPRLAEKVTRGSAEERGLAVQALAEMGMPEYADAVEKALDDDSPVVAMIAARGLFRRGQERHFPHVLLSLPAFVLWSRSFLASMLAGGGGEAAPLLRQLLSNPNEPSLVRAVATDALRGLNDLESVEVALTLLEDETDRELMTGCLRLVRQLGHRGHVDEIMRFVTDSDPVIRAAAVGAVGQLGGDDDVPVLQSVLGDDAYWVSLEAARGLMSLGEVTTLRRLAGGDGPWSVLARQVLNE